MIANIATMSQGFLNLKLRKSGNGFQLEINRIEQRNELLLLIEDMNKHVGNDELGVVGNHSKISSGGELIRGIEEQAQGMLGGRGGEQNFTRANYICPSGKIVTKTNRKKK